MNPRLLASAAAALLLAGPATATETQSSTGFGGTWHADPGWTLTIQDRQIREAVGNEVRVDSDETCPDFMFEVSSDRGQALIERYDTPGFIDPSGFPLFGDVAPHLDSQAVYPVLWTSCIGRGEIAYTVTFILLNGDRLMQVTQGDGVADLQGFARTVPMPTDAWRGRDERLLIQRGLANLGLYAGSIDADFGPLTRSAIAAFQNGRGEEPTGILSGEQEIALRRAAF